MTRRLSSSVPPLLSVLLLLVCWEAAGFVLGSDVLSGPWATGIAVGAAVRDGYLWSDLAVTCARLLAAFALGFTLSLTAGLLLGLSRLGRLFGLWVTIAASVPALVYVVACYLTLGISDRAAIVAVALVVAPSTITTIWDGLRTADASLREMSRSFGAGRWLALTHVTIPQAVPWIFTAARSCWSLTWRIMVFVELIGRPNGVGYRIQYWFNLANMPRVMASAIPLVGVVVLLEVGLFRTIESRLTRWRPFELQEAAVPGR